MIDERESKEEEAKEKLIKMLAELEALTNENLENEKYMAILNDFFVKLKKMKENNVSYKERYIIAFPLYSKLIAAAA